MKARILVAVQLSLYIACALALVAADNQPRKAHYRRAEANAGQQRFACPRERRSPAPLRRTT